MNDKPRLTLARLLNDAADICTALRLAGCSEEQVGRVARRYAEARLGLARRDPAPPGPEWGWRDGRWVPLGDETSEQSEPLERP